MAESDVDGLDPQAIEQALWKAFVPTAGYIELSCTILIVYEYLLTIDMERRAIWSRKMSAPTILFYVNRYSLLVFGLALVLWGFVVWDEDSSCIAPAVMQTVTGIVIEACYVAFSALRIHAINNYRWFWTVSIILLGGMPFPINLADLIVGDYLTLRPILLGCGVAKTSGITLDEPVWQRVAVAVAACQILSESLVLVITWYRTAGIVIAARKTFMDVSLVSLLLRDGTIFFCLSLATHIMIMVLDVKRATSLGLISCTLMSISMTRFILHLRTVEPSGNGNGVFTAQRSSMPDFRLSSPVFDNIGAPLDFDGPGDYDELDQPENDMAADTNQELFQSSGPYQMGEYSPVPKTESFEY